MVIIDCNNFESVDEYIKSLSNRARHEHTLVYKRNVGVEYREAKFETETVHRFMELWGRQLVRGKPIEWAYPVGTVEQWYLTGELKIFEAVKDRILAMHFIKKENGYWEAQPPMWDKEHMKEQHFGTFMWFELIKWGIRNKLGIINLGGGVDSWREMIRTRNQYTNPKYKWRFIPNAVKSNPDLQPDYKIIDKTLCLN